jgi:hypothetical protein
MRQGGHFLDKTIAMPFLDKIYLSKYYLIKLFQLKLLGVEIKNPTAVG